MTSTAEGATFVLDATGDAGDTNPGDGVCDSILAGTDCTLRAAVQEANALAGPDTIEAPTLLYTLNIPGSDDAAAVGDLDVTDDLVIRGIGSPTINTTHGESAIELRSGTLTLENLAFDGQGIRTLGGTRSTLREVGISNAMSTALVNQGSMSAHRLALDSNTGVDAGAIDNQGTLLLTSSTLSWNSATGFSGDTSGAILNHTGATMHVANVELLYNSITRTVTTLGDLCAQAIVNYGSLSLVHVGLYGTLSTCSNGVIGGWTGEIANAGDLELRATWMSTASSGSICVADGYLSTPPTQRAVSLGYNTISDDTCLASPTTGDDETGAAADGIPPELCPIYDVDLEVSRVDAGYPTCARGGSQYTSLRACADGVDNDEDGLIDLLDPGCASVDDPSEAHLRPGDYVIANFDLGGASGFDPITTHLFPLARWTGRAFWDVEPGLDGAIGVSDADLGALSALDPTDGVATIQASGGLLDRPTGIARAGSGEWLVADQTTDTVVQVAPGSGAQGLVLSDAGFAGLDDLLLDPADGSLLVSAAAASLLHRVTDPLGSPGLSTFSTSLLIRPRQLVFDDGGDVILADDNVNAPLRFDPSTSTDTNLITPTPFSSLQGAAAEPSGLFLFTDYTTGEIVRIDDATDTVTVLNVGREEPGINHLFEVPKPAELTLTLSDALVVDGGTAGRADVGDVLELTAVVTNMGASTADLLSLESGLDPNLTLVAGSLSTSQGAIVEGSLASDPRLEVDLGSLAPAASASVTWHVDVGDPAPGRTVSANAWIRREKLILAESDDPTTGPGPDPNRIGVGDYGIIVQAVQKISDTRGTLSGAGNPGAVLGVNSYFGGSVEPLGDVDGDGVPDVAVGAYYDDEGGAPGYGSFFILLLEADGTVKQRFEWNAARPDLAAALSNAGLALGADNFGSGIAYLGDLDAAGPSDFALAVSAWYDDGAGIDRGAVYVVFMDASPLQVLSVTKIGDGVGGFPAGQLSDFDYFGSDIENVGDIDGDGVNDLAVGAHLDDTIGADSGGVWVLFLTPSGTVKASPSPQILVAPAAAGDYLGLGIAALGLFDGDGVPDLAVSASRRDVGGPDRGAVWILTLNSDGTIKTQTEISPGVGGLPSDLLEDDDRFGRDLETLPDLDGDGTVELVVGANRDSDAGFRTGATYVMFLTPAGTTDQVVQLAPQPGVLFHELASNDRFGIAIAPLGDLDSDGAPEIAVGALLDNDAASDAGAVYVLHTAKPLPEPDALLGLVSGIAFLAAIGRRRTRR